MFFVQRGQEDSQQWEEVQGWSSRDYSEKSGHGADRVPGQVEGGCLPFRIWSVGLFIEVNGRV